MMMIYSDKLKTNLQFFAGSEGGTDTGTNPEGKGSEGGTGTDKGAEPIVFDQSEVDRRISKAVESALSKQQEKFATEKETAIEEARIKAEEYSKLTEREKLVKDLDSREQKIKSEMQALDQRKLMTDVEIDLKEKSLPISFASALVTMGDAEKIKATVVDLKKAFDLSVAEQVKETIRQETPKDNNSMRRTTSEANSIADFARKNRIIGN